MEYQSIHIQGNIVSTEILDKIRTEDIKFQQAADFGLDSKTTVRDEIGVAWSAARSVYTAFRLRADRLKEGESGVSETRSSWIIPLMQQLGYTVEKAPAFIHPDTKKSYAISHRAGNRGDFPVHIMGVNDDLDKRRENGGPRLSPHALVQEYLNNDEHTYALVTNGNYLRLLRDATRLVRLSYLEFDLKKMMEEDLYSDFAVMFRLLHASRMPKQTDALEDSFIEFYHQESLASGSRIRERLSIAVESSIKVLANGFLQNPDNEPLREQIRSNKLASAQFYQLQLRLIYRLLFLIVTEERHLVYPETRDPEIQRKRKIYYDYYSIERLRRLAIKIHYVDRRKHDLWEGLKSTFLLFEEDLYAERLGIKPLGSGLFDSNAMGMLPHCILDNDTLLKVIRHLTLFENDQQQLVRVNYSDLDVEEFGSVYEGLLEYDAVIHDQTGQLVFAFVKGTGRSSSGSHYTPEELVKPLIKHSLDYIIEDKLKEADKEKALLSIKVCDVACGSGHILLSAARRIAIELARVRTHEDQPTPTAMRSAIRDVIKSCIYGVDKNPLAVELCKVALWLEAHNPGDPLNFLDHHIKCGDSIVGLAHKEELANGIADEAFKTLPGDDKDVAGSLRKRNKQERADRKQRSISFEQHINQNLEDVLKVFDKFNAMPERTPQEIAAKEAAYKKLTEGPNWWRLKKLADLQVAQFFVPKTKQKQQLLTTDADYYKYLRGERSEDARSMAEAVTESSNRHFFHWFLEFPKVFSTGGFNCILGNPPYLGDRRLREVLGEAYLEWIRYCWTPDATVDLVVYFFRRIFDITCPQSFLSLISTNTVAQVKARECGLEKITQDGGVINHAVRSMYWPGTAAVEVSLVTIHKGAWQRKRILNHCEVEFISSFLDSSESIGTPWLLFQNSGRSYQGTIVLGTGFILEPREAQAIIDRRPISKEVIFPYVNGDDLNSQIDQSPTRFVINVTNLPLQRSTKPEWESFDERERRRLEARHLMMSPDYKGRVVSDYPECFDIINTRVKAEREKGGAEEASFPYWWFWRPRTELYKAVRQLDRVLVSSRVSKYVSHSFLSAELVYDVTTNVILRTKYWEYALFQNTLHEQWARKYASTLASRIRYLNGDCIETYPFPQDLDSERLSHLEDMGERYYNYRMCQMKGLQIGLTKLYNLFHARRLDELNDYDISSDDKALEKKFGKDALYLRKHLHKAPGTCSFNEAVAGIQKLRELHKELDQAVLETYGWQDIQLRHDFYEVDYLPEDDRVRFTIHPDARREVLKRLLDLNHKIHEAEVNNPSPAKPKSKPRKPKPDNGTERLL